MNNNTNNAKTMEANNTKSYNFVTRYESTRSGFNHYATLFVEGEQPISAKCHYINRTWEAYPFQSVKREALCLLVERKVSERVQAWKNETGRTRLNKGQREQITEQVRKEYDFIKI